MNIQEKEKELEQLMDRSEKLKKEIGEYKVKRLKPFANEFLDLCNKHGVVPSDSYIKFHETTEDRKILCIDFDGDLSVRSGPPRDDTIGQFVKPNAHQMMAIKKMMSE